MRRVQTSWTKAAYTQPEQVRMYVMSATHRRSGRSAVKFRLTRSGRVSTGPGVVVRVVTVAAQTVQAGDFHQPFDGAAAIRAADCPAGAFSARLRLIAAVQLAAP